MPFRPRTQSELDALTDEALIAYVLDARDAGDADSAKSALRVLVWGHWGRVKAKVGLKVPRADVEDVAAEAITSALTAAFDGQSVGEFTSWLNTIVQRRVADYHRRIQRGLREVSVDDERGDEALPWEADGSGYVEVRVILQDLMDALEPAHREVVRLYVFDDLAAGEVEERLPNMTVDNIHQIASRFRRQLRERLEAGDG